MAEFGFRANGALGNKQIDSNYSNMKSIQSGSVSLSNQWSTMKSYNSFLGSSTRTFDSSSGGCEDNCLPTEAYSRYWCGIVNLTTPSTYQPCVAIRPSANDSWSFCYNHGIDSNGDGKYDKILFVAGTDLSNLTRVNYNTGSVGSLDYIVFNYPDGLSKSSDTYGMRLYDSSGDLVFDSGYDYLKVLKSQTFNISPTAGESLSYTPVSSSSYYIFSHFPHNQYGTIDNWGCPDGSSDYYARTFFSMNGLSKKTNGDISIDWGQYANVYGCTGLTSTNNSTTLNILEVVTT